MDDKDKDVAAGAGVGAVGGFLIGGPLGAAVGSVLGGAVGSYEEKHNKLTRETFYKLSDSTSNEAKLYVDHIDPEGAEEGNTQNVLEGVSGKPDIIVTDFRTRNLVIEVETWKGIQDDPQHALKQLDDFRKQGYKRILVGPEDELEEILEWVERHEGKGNISGPELLVASPNRVERFMTD